MAAPKRRKPPEIDTEALDNFFTTLQHPYPPPGQTDAGPAVLDRLTERAQAAEAAALELFPPRAETAPLPLPRPPARWRGCVCCGAKDALPAAEGHDICVGCTVDPAATRAALEGLWRAAVREMDQAGAAYAAAEAALDLAEAPRWATFCELWIIAEAGMADEEQRRKVKVTLEAYKAPAHPRITPALRRVWTAWEVMWWADQAALGRKRQYEVKLAQLGLALEALGRKDEANALYGSK